MSQRRVNRRTLTDRPRRSLAKWIQPPEVKPGQQPITPGCWWSCVSITFAFGIVVFLLVRWLV